MTLKVQILQTLRWLFIILVGLTMTRFSEKMLIFNIRRRGLMPNWIKKSWMVSKAGLKFNMQKKQVHHRPLCLGVVQ